MAKRASGVRRQASGVGRWAAGVGLTAVRTGRKEIFDESLQADASAENVLSVGVPSLTLAVSHSSGSDA
jgi:hypothetical protein